MPGRGVARRVLALLAVVAVACAVAAGSVAAAGVSAQRRLGHGHRRAKHAVDKRPPDLSRYHSTEQLIAEFRALQETCPHLHVGTRKGAEKELVTVEIRRPAPGPATEARFAEASERLRVLLFFGEHARELISPETALRFTQMLCGVTPAGHATPSERELQRIARVVDNADVLLFPVINADGHERVVKGSYCTRTNARGVDLNRNWDEHWKRSHRADTNGGARAFSEDEVRILRDAATHYNPDMFVSIHSGALGMYTPYTYSTKRPSGVVEQQMVGILKGLNPHYCNCDVGAAGKELNYLCPGTCLDYVFDKLQTPYAFAVEIWEGGFGYKKQPRSYRSPFEALLQTHERSHHSHSHGHTHGHGHSALKAKAKRAVAQHTEAVPAATADSLKLGSCFLLSEEQQKQKQQQHNAAADAGADADADAEEAEEEDVTAFVEVDAEADEEEGGESGALFPPPRNNAAHTCLSSFNPTNPTDYIATTDNWSHALMAMIDRVLDTDHRAPKRDA